ncbi:L,D-transpeptidase family protein [Shewanella inventionis]|uniref:Peptidoglycan-binding protein n=1 Tax=Shewanella inventionis TaxID=1738770 RepID=A0ABQ1ITR8_9GAMM|nr:L,D-transpeptidase family protein [Shewanella inventionis]MCL1156884.1 L,D-transpeptidase family protein [Shewanella inventionis]GGB50983.1 peptidoglycan-binding protein [Shewanella inventionis]
MLSQFTRPRQASVMGILLLCISSCVFADNTTQYDNLIQHLQLQYLAEPTAQRAQYLTILQTGSAAEQLEYIDIIQRSVASFWQQKQVPLAFDTLDENASVVAKNIALEPAVTDYLGVVNYLRKLMWLAETQTWPTIAPEGLLRPGDVHPSIKQISQRLWLLGDANEYLADELVYQDTLAQSVKRFQSRHGLTSDAVIGPKTLFWLNQTPQQRATLLAKSFVEKTTYLSQLPQPYLLINIPAFQMVLVDNDEVVLASKVIVGKPARQTPLMTGQISNVIINPTWTVPRQLLRHDILPQVKVNGHYFKDRHFDVFDFDGNLVIKTPQQWQVEAAGRFPYRVVQRPGGDNALGRYKFHFNNDQSIYLHDTPTKSLFAKADRDLSSGCVRIEKVQQLADWFAKQLVIDKRTWHRLQKDYTTTQWFALSGTLPVHMVYWRAWVDDAHIAQYRHDIYQLSPVAPANLLSQKMRPQAIVQ